jgi:hypothetical protein
MMNAFEVLRHDHDQVMAMLTRLMAGPTARTGASRAQLVERKRLTDRVIDEASRHEAVEQQHFWPVLRRLGAEGEYVAGQAAGLGQDAGQVLARLGQLEPTDEWFEDLLVRFIAGARRHIAFGEAQAWPVLRGRLSGDEADDLGAELAQARQAAGQA